VAPHGVNQRGLLLGGQAHAAMYAWTAQPAGNIAAQWR
jgi:hypothetical protein